MWATITKPFAWLMVKLYELTGNYGLAVILFALAVNLVLTPFMAKSKKSMMRSTRLQPRIQELQRRHEGNPQKLNQEMQNLYREEGVTPVVTSDLETVEICRSKNLTYDYLRGADYLPRLDRKSVV